MSQSEHKFEIAYGRMIEAIHETLERAKKEGRSVEHWFRQAADDAVEKEIELEALTREEALRVRDFVARDLHDASSFMKEAKGSLKFSYDLDKEYAEDRFFNAFRNAADPTEMGQFLLAQELQERSEFHAGQVTAMGALICKGCSEVLHFKKPGNIPPCPSCQGTVYEREG